MKVTVTSVMVDDQRKALKFYTETLGFQLKRNIPLGEANWLTVVSKEEPDGVELLLEPSSFEPAKIYRKALYEAGIPATVFSVADINQEYTRLTNLGVQFTMLPQQTGTAILAVFDDTCGNLIEIYQLNN